MQADVYIFIPDFIWGYLSDNDNSYGWSYIFQFCVDKFKVDFSKTLNTYYEGLIGRHCFHIQILKQDISTYTANTKQLYTICTMSAQKHLYNISTTSAQRLRRWSNIVQMLYKCFWADIVQMCLLG